MSSSVRSGRSRREARPPVRSRPRDGSRGGAGGPDAEEPDPGEPLGGQVVEERVGDVVERRPTTKVAPPLLQEDAGVHLEQEGTVAARRSVTHGGNSRIVPHCRSERWGPNRGHAASPRTACAARARCRPCPPSVSASRCSFCGCAASGRRRSRAGEVPRPRPAGGGIVACRRNALASQPSVLGSPIVAAPGFRWREPC